MDIEIIISFISVCTAVGCTYFQQLYFQQKPIEELRSLKPLRDCLHQPWNASWQKYRWIPDRVNDAFIGLFIWYVLGQEGKGTCFLVITLSISYILRGVFCRLTELPPCNPHFYQMVHAASDMANKKQTIPLDPHRGFHFDLIYSGHVSLMVAVVCHFYEFQVWTPFFCMLLGLVAALNSLVIIVTRCHYSVDVVVAWVIVPMLYRLMCLVYH